MRGLALAPCRVLRYRRLGRGSRAASREEGAMTDLRTLAIDIGGTGIKAVLLDEAGQIVSDRERVPTPSKPIAPDVLMQAIGEVTAPLGEFRPGLGRFPRLCARRPGDDRAQSRDRDFGAVSIFSRR